MIKLKYQSLENVEKKASEDVEVIMTGLKGDKFPENIKKLCEKVLMLMISSKRMKDIESQYILGYRALILMNKIKALTQNDIQRRNYANSIFKPNLESEMTHQKFLMDDLKSKLSQLYDQQNTRVPSLNLEAVHNDHKPSSPLPMTTTKTTLLSSNVPQIISCKKLFEILTQAKPDEVFLLMDIRKSTDFSRSHIENTNRLVNPAQFRLINIPEEKIQKGLTALHIELMLPTSDQLLFKNRRNATLVLLMDWDSEGLGKNERLDIVYHALSKFDNAAERLNKLPAILFGGYNEWTESYPHFSTDSTFKKPSKENYGSNTITVRNNDRVETMTTFYDYSNLEESEPPKQNLVPSPVKPLTPKQMNVGNETDKCLPNDFKQMHLTNRKHNVFFPGMAKPIPDDRMLTNKMNVTNSSIIISPSNVSNGLSSRHSSVDSGNETNDFLLRKREEIDQQFLKYAQEEDEKKIKSQDEQIKQLRNENVTLKRSLKPKMDSVVHAVVPSASPSTPEPHRKDIMWPSEDNSSLSNSTFESNGSSLNAPGFLSPLAIKPNDSMHTLRKSRTEAENNVVNQRNSNERTMSECHADEGGSSFPINRRGSLGHGLHRAHSSPSLANLDDKDSNQFAHGDEPINKPVFDRSTKPLSKIDYNQSRDFQPVYRSSSETAVSPGLRNLGNTCFMNAVIQCLFNTHEFSSYFYTKLYKHDVNRKSKFGTGGQLCEEFGELMSSLALGIRQYKHITPSDFKRVVGRHIPFMGGYDQQDSHEFLLILLEKLHADLNRAAIQDPPPVLSDDLSKDLAIDKFWKAHLERNKSIVSSLFEGLIMSTLECQYCKNVSNTFEVFSCLSLPIPQPNGRCKLSDCLKAFLQQEVMEGEAAWDCPKCKQKRESIKKTSIVKLPKVLLIQLKRFSYEGMWKQKVRTFVEFPMEELNLRHSANYMADTPLYELIGIVNHFGTLEGGHYKATCRVKKEGVRRWYKYDDQEVSEIGSSEVISQDAYILFYVTHTLNVPR